MWKQPSAQLNYFPRALGFLVAVSLHVVVIALLLRDRIAMPVSKIGQSVIVQIFQTKNRPLENLTLPPLNLDKAPPIIFNPPQLDLPLGKQMLSKPMVVISAKFAPDVALIVPASEYPANLPRIADIYRAEISVQVLENGATGNVYIERSGGDRVIDNFIVTYGWSHWRFAPSLSDGVPVMSWKTVRVDVRAKEMIVRG
jgi:hypothetical protein